ncbi:MAG: hypothetical protein JJW01_02815 [Alphaproteobacteria bacterium]|nr:hypothetical protein [Rickettsiales bacterium]
MSSHLSLSYKDFTLLPDLITEVGDIILQKRNEGYQVSRKKDGTFVTSVDLLANKYIKSLLRSKFGKDIKIVSEENDEWENAQNECSEYFLIDPIDGTSFFIRGGDFCINIAYVVNGIPVFGIIGIPTKGEIFFNDKNNVYKQTKNDTIRLLPQFSTQGHKKNYAMISNHRSIIRTSGDSFNADDMGQRLETMCVKISCKLSAVAAIKYCLLIEGVGDFVLSFGTISAWDIAAPNALCRAMGIHFTDSNGKELNFGYTVKNQSVFASGYNFLHRSLLTAFKNPL